MSKEERKPCAECYYCIAIGGGEGLCDFKVDPSKKKIVDLFDVEPYCPRLQKETNAKG